MHVWYVDHLTHLSVTAEASLRPLEQSPPFVIGALLQSSAPAPQAADPAPHLHGGVVSPAVEDGLARIQAVRANPVIVIYERRQREHEREQHAEGRRSRDHCGSGALEETECSSFGGALNSMITGVSSDRSVHGTPLTLQSGRLLDAFTANDGACGQPGHDVSRHAYPSSSPEY